MPRDYIEVTGSVNSFIEPVAKVVFIGINIKCICVFPVLVLSNFVKRKKAQTYKNEALRNITLSRISIETFSHCDSIPPRIGSRHGLLLCYVMCLDMRLHPIVNVGGC